MQMSQNGTAGENVVTADVSALRGGLYLYQIEAGEDRAVGKLVVK